MAVAKCEHPVTTILSPSSAASVYGFARKIAVSKSPEPFATQPTKIKAVGRKKSGRRAHSQTLAMRQFRSCSAAVTSKSCSKLRSNLAFQKFEFVDVCYSICIPRVCAKSNHEQKLPLFSDERQYLVDQED